MATTPPSSLPGAVVIDASIAVALAAKESRTEPVALAELRACSSRGDEFFAPGAIVAETLYVLCRKHQTGLLSAVDYAQAVTDFENFMSGLLSPPHGENTLIQRAYAIGAGYTCRHSADGIYIALAEQLTLMRPTILLTFDQDMPKQATRNAPAVQVYVLTI